MSALFEINIATLAFFGLMLARFIFLYPLTFNSSEYLYLKQIPCRKHVVISLDF